MGSTHAAWKMAMVMTWHVSYVLMGIVGVAMCWRAISKGKSVMHRSTMTVEYVQFAIAYSFVV